MRLALTLAVSLLLAACGATAPLKPKPGALLPPKPLAAAVPPDADALMEPSDQARPQRIDDVLKRSEVRAADPFDLPPPG